MLILYIFLYDFDQVAWLHMELKPVGLNARGIQQFVDETGQAGNLSRFLFHQFVDFAVRNVAIQKRVVSALLQQLLGRIPRQGEGCPHDC